jgi:hypothetical protein
MRSAVYDGFMGYGSASVPDPPFKCPTGNCTWDPFHTLAVGVQCQDAPEQYRIDCNSNPNVTVCEIIRNPRFKNMTRLAIPIEGWSGLYQPVMYLSVATDMSKSSRYPRVIDPMGRRADIEWVRVTNLNATHRPITQFSKAWISPNSTYESRQCKLYTCVNVVKAQVTNGVYNEDVIQEIANPVFEPDLTMDGKHLGTDFSGGGSFTHSSYNVTWTYKPVSGAPRNLSIDWVEHRVILSNFQAPFQDLRGWYEQDIWSGKLNTTTYANQYAGPEILQRIYMARNLTDMVVSVVRCTNVALRSFHTYQAMEAQPNLPRDFVSEDEQVAGIVWRDTLHVGVQWSWLALPATLLVLGILLLVATIWSSHNQKVGIWKDNSLALLLSSQWDREDRSSVRAGQTQLDIQRGVKGMKAQLAEDMDAPYGDLKGTMPIESARSTRKGLDDLVCSQRTNDSTKGAPNGVHSRHTF